MKVIDVPFAVLRFQYRIARLPLEVIEQRVMTRLDLESPARLFYEHSLGRLDVTVGNALGDSSIEQRGAALAERSGALRRAAQLDTAAEGQTKQSRQKFEGRREEAAERQDSARKARAEAKKAQQSTSAVRDAKRQEEEQIHAMERAAAKAAESKLDAAGEKRSEAAAKRSQADRLDELVEVKKDQRQRSRNNGSD